MGDEQNDVARVKTRTLNYAVLHQLLNMCIRAIDPTAI